MKWLTIENALADYIAILQYVKSTNPQLANSKIIVVGGANISAKGSKDIRPHPRPHFQALMEDF